MHNGDFISKIPHIDTSYVDAISKFTELVKNDLRAEFNVSTAAILSDWIYHEITDPEDKKCYSHGFIADGRHYTIDVLIGDVIEIIIMNEGERI